MSVSYTQARDSVKFCQTCIWEFLSQASTEQQWLMIAWLLTTGVNISGNHNYNDTLP